MAVGGNFTSCNCGPGTEVCQSPTEPVATVGLCLPDGTPIAVTVVRDCAGNTAAEGWIDLASGQYTAGPAPAGAAACDAGCADTICVTRCDDSDGDGQPDVTYSELWCVRVDGSTTLLLTYQGDPSQPYTPTAPVECTYGCPQMETVTLCDESGPFLRRYVFVDGAASYEDVALDGTTPHVVTGTVGACAGSGGGPTGCAEQTTPAATLGLCLPDGTPLAVLITRDCDGTTTQDGWLNLTTGTYTSGPPPAGAAACGDARAFELAGLLCDTDPATGDVYALVLVEYAYNADGSLASVRLVDPGTGSTYTLQGELRRCPADAGAELPEQDLTVLCDTAADGTSTAFVRDYRRDPATGQITGLTDYTLDGQPYTATGTVGTCSPAPEPCRSSTSLLVCDLPAGGTPTATVTDTDPTPYYPFPTAAPVAGAQALWDGGTLTLPPGTGPQPGTTGSVNSLAAVLQAPRPACDTGTAHVTVTLNVQQTGPDNGCGPTGHLRLFTGTTQAALTVLPASTPNGYFGTLTVEATVPAADLAAGNVAFALALDAYDDTATCVPSPRRTGWTLSAFTTAVTYDQAGCETQFLRTVTVDCETGSVTGVEDTTLDGQPYTVTGEVGQCAPAGGGECCPPPEPEPCRDTATVLLCDQPPATSTEPVPLATLAPGPTGGTLPNGVSYTVSAGEWYDADQGYIVFAERSQTWTFDQPVRVEFSIGGLSAVGECAVLPAGVELVTLGPDHTYDPATRRLCPIAGGNTSHTTFRTTGAVQTLTWQASGLTNMGRGVTSMLVSLIEEPVQFLRRIVTDCSTGEVVSVTDSTLDGQPYTVTGEAGQCQTAGGGGGSVPEPCRNTSSVLLCDAAAGTETVATAVTDATLADTGLAGMTAFPPAPAPWAPLWAGGPYTFPRDTSGAAGDGVQAYRTVVGRITGTVPEDCGQAAGEVTVSVRVRNDGPDAGVGGSGWLRIWRDGVQLAVDGLTSPPVGHVQTLTVTAPATAEDLATGRLVLSLSLETYHQPTSKSWTADQFTVTSELTGCAVQFLRNVTVDCETGAVTAVTDTTLDGQPYTVTGEVGQCRTTGGGQAPPPCGDTEVVQLCDLVYSPQPPVPLPPDSFTLTGSVQVQGGALVYSGGNATVNGMAERAVTGLIDGAAYEFRFDAGWNGSGAPGGSQAAYRVEVLDGTTVLASRDRNLSGASTASGPLTAQDPILFMAPASGAVTVRFTDLTTNGGINRDLVIRPGAVQTEALTVTATPFLRALTFDCAGQPVASQDLALDGVTPYEAQGQDGACPGSSGTGGGGVPPEACGSTQTTQLCDTLPDGSTTPFLRTYTFDCEGQVTGTADTGLDGTTPYEVQGEAGPCPAAEPGCPRAFSTECWAAIERTEASYDNTSMINGTPGTCGTVLGPVDDPGAGANFGCNGGPYTITSWIINGQETVTPGAEPTFTGGPCGPGMHTNWATALNALDPSATWVIDRKPGCYWYVRSEGGTGNTYGPMIIEGPGRWIPDSRWVLYPAQDVIEDRYTRVYNQDCDGTVSVSWLDAAGAPTDPPAGELERCSTGCCPNDDGGGKPTQPDPWQDSEVLVLCDVADDGQRTVFLRRLHYTDAEHPRIVDTLLDGTTLYEPAGQVGQCDCTSHLVEQCRCDDVNGDGSSIVRYVELLAVDGCTGELTSLGIFTEDLSGPYEPANPVPCEPAGAPAVTGVQARRVELVPGASWSAADHPTLQSVTAVAHGGAGTITTADGPSTLHAGEAVSWGVGRDSDAFLVGPLSITAGTGTIALAFTIGVTL